ncbi:unnamed protein product [Brassica oleracea]
MLLFISGLDSLATHKYWEHPCHVLTDFFLFHQTFHYLNCGMADRFVQNVIVSEGQCKQKNCHQECKKSCHVFQTGTFSRLIFVLASSTVWHLCIE